MWLRTLTASALVGSLFLACGGRTDEGVGTHVSSSSSSGGSSGGSSSGGSSSGGSSGGSSSGSSSGSTMTCTFVDLSTYDTSCNSAADCEYITGGPICDGYCQGCGNDLVNASEVPRYDAAVASIVPGQCECGVPAPPACVNHQCLQGSFSVDAGPPPADAGVCIYVDITSYDRSCKADSDCIDITSGSICADQCICGGSAINAEGQAQYDQALAQLGPMTSPCGCPYLGRPRCIQSTCTFCESTGGGGQPAGCPDGG